jgi:Leucine-rich repeat (LRR) protein
MAMSIDDLPLEIIWLILALVGVDAWKARCISPFWRKSVLEYLQTQTDLSKLPMLKWEAKVPKYYPRVFTWNTKVRPTWHGIRGIKAMMSFKAVGLKVIPNVPHEIVYQANVHMKHTFPYIKQCKNLRELQTDHGQLSEIHSLKCLPHLQKLEIYNNHHIKEIKAPLEMPSLREFTFDHGSLRNIDGLRSLTNLRELSLFKQRFKDISCVVDMSQLTVLNLNDNMGIDPSPIQALSGLITLNLNDCGISDLSFLANLTNLQVLYLCNNKLTDIEELSKLTKLEGLFLNKNAIRDIQVIQNLKQLTNIHLSRNKISNIDSIRQLPLLEHLAIVDNPILDITPIRDVSTLETLSISQTYRDTISQFIQDPVRVFYW